VPDALTLIGATALPRFPLPAQTCLGAVMSRYAAPLAFTLASLWVAILFVLVSK
jgi:hypothetical protein